MDMNKELKLVLKLHKKVEEGGGGSGPGVGLGSEWMRTTN